MITVTHVLFIIIYIIELSLFIYLFFYLFFYLFNVFSSAIYFVGVFVGNIPVLVRAQLNKDDASGVVLKMAVRSSSKEVSQLVSECIR